MKYILLLISITIGLFSFSQYSINYMSVTAGAIVGDGTTNVNYFGPADYGDIGTCNSVASWRWIDALCSAVGNENDLVNSTKTNYNSGSTWYAGGGASKYMVVDLSTVRNFNELYVFQMHESSDGMITSVQMYSHPNTTVLPTYFDAGWVSLFTETATPIGTATGSTISDPTVINFSYTTSRFVLIEVKNDGSLAGDAGTFAEVRELRLFNTNITLPVELLSFNASSIKNNIVKLDWQTASETNNDFFTIERSKNGKVWKNIHEIKGSGNSSHVLNYDTFDTAPYKGMSYYRLKQTDFNGETSVSEIKSVSFDELSDDLITIFPNPTKNKITIKSNSLKINSIKIFNSLGQELTNNVIFEVKSEHKIVVDLSELNIGIYFIQTGTSINKIIKE